MSELLYEISDHIATLTFNRPDRMNTISGPMLNELSKRLLEADRDPDVRVIVLTGAGRAFCAGLDIAAQSSGGGLGDVGREPRRVRPSRRATDRAPQRRHADRLRPQRWRCRLRHGHRARLRHPHRRGVVASWRRRSPSAASFPRAAARGCCPAWSATPRRPRSPSPAARSSAKECLELGLVNQVVPDSTAGRRDARARARDRRERTARRAGDEAHDAHGRDRDVRAERAPRLPAAAPAVPQRGLQGGHGRRSSRSAPPTSRAARPDRSAADPGVGLGATPLVAPHLAPSVCAQHVEVDLGDRDALICAAVDDGVVTHRAVGLTDHPVERDRSPVVRRPGIVRHRDHEHVLVRAALETGRSARPEDRTRSE